MTKKKSTKRALLLSALSLLMCVSMLIGSTFAWFTDSVTSGSNVIQAGTLDIVMEYWDGTQWVDAEGKVLQFQKADTSAGTEVLWEPGCTYQLPKFRIRNVGTLAAKVLIRLNGINGDEKLMEAIKLTNTITNMPDSVLNGSYGAQLGRFNNATIDLMYGTPEGTLIFDWSLMGQGVVSPNSGHTDTSPEFTITGHMDKNAGNEYQGLSIEGISITALAAQEVYEYDSFGREYDANTEQPNVVNTAVELQAAINAAVDGDIIVVGSNMTANVTAPQKPGVHYTIDGNGKTLNGTITVDGKSSEDTTAGLTIKNFKFVADTVATEACINLGVNGNNNTRYIRNLTVENCYFNVPGKVAVKSYSNGDRNLKIVGCTVEAGMHSLLQVNNVAGGLVVENCKLYSKNGINTVQSENVTIRGCEADVLGYAVRFGASSGGEGIAETYVIDGCTLKSANNDGDATVILRGTADYATLNITNTTIVGNPDIANSTNAIVNK